MKTDKLSIDSLVIEVTRKCQLECSHCLRGDAESLVMDTLKYLPPVLKKVNYISSVTFTGGEPSLHPEAITDFIALCKIHSVEVGNFYIATNGVNISKDFVLACMELFLFCDDNEISQVNLSNDAYHYDNDSVSLLSALSFFSNKHTDRDKNYSPINEGRGWGDRTLSKECFEIEESLISEGVLYLNCEGNVVGGCDWSYDSQRNPENIICKATDFDMESIINFASAPAMQEVC